jgi:DNA-binding response OmpR family regulator
VVVTEPIHGEVGSAGCSATEETVTIHSCQECIVTFSPKQRGVSVNGKFRKLTKREMLFFQCLVNHRGAVATHTTLIAAGIPNPGTREISVHICHAWISRVRYKLGPHADKIVVTMTKWGYKLKYSCPHMLQTKSSTYY